MLQFLVFAYFLLDMIKDNTEQQFQSAEIDSSDSLNATEDAAIMIDTMDIILMSSSYFLTSQLLFGTNIGRDI